MNAGAAPRAVNARPNAMLVAPVPVLARREVRLFLTSAVLLFTELLLIRWIPAEVVYVGFFSNFILMGSFLGIGVGILYGRAGATAGTDGRARAGPGAGRLPFPPFAVLLLVVVALIGTAKLDVELVSPNDIFFGLADTSNSNLGVIVLPLVVALVTIVMAALATPLGGLLVSMPPLRAYTFDILGSLVGIAAFTCLSALQTPPPAWFGALAVGLALLGLGKGVVRGRVPVALAVLSAAAMVGVVGLSVTQLHRDTWSPYYRISVYRSDGWERINVNGIPHQSIQLSTPVNAGLYYEQVYKWFPDRTFGRVLVVGAGGGTDVQYALAHGAQHVDAVEIDPAILQLGRNTNPGHPYQDPRVTTYTEDGRAFLRNTSATYDLIVFALPDSLTLVSSTSNIRLESFLFTTQAFESVRQHLAPGGVFTLYNFYRQPWLVQRLAGMLHGVFPGPILVHPFTQLNSEAASLAAGPGLASAASVSTIPAADIASGSYLQQAPQPATDDWPFLYLFNPSIAGYYLIALGLILTWALVLAWRGARVSGTSLRRFSPHFFALGAAFLLLETRSLVTYSLLFGTTWIVNSLVFFAILLSVLAAILVAARVRVTNARWLYLALFVALALNFLLPPAALLLDPPWVRYALASLLAFAPVFCANLVFTYSFRDTRTADMAFASNLLGAMVGGVLEYASLITGYQALLILVGALYGLAYLFARRWRVLADRELAPDAATTGILAEVPVTLALGD